MKLKPALLLILITFFLVGCSNDDSPNEAINMKDFIGNKYAHLLFNTREECETAQELYFTNCAQDLEIVNDTEAVIYLTDILYKTGFYIENGKLVVESSPETYEFSEDLIFEILDNGDLRLGEDIWIKYEDDFYE